MHDDDARYRKTRTAEVNAVPDGYLLSSESTDRVHFLNPAAAVVFELCTGAYTQLEIAGILKDSYRLDDMPRDAVRECISALLSEGLIEKCD